MKGGLADRWPRLGEIRRWCEQLAAASAAPSDLALQRALDRAVRLSAGDGSHAAAALFFTLADNPSGTRPLDPALPGHVAIALARRNGRRIRASKTDLAAVARLVQCDRVGLGAVAAWLEHVTELAPATDDGR